MNRITIVIALFAAAVVAHDLPAAQGGMPALSSEPFKLGTFEIRGAPRVGLVLRDSLVIELNPANAALEKSPLYPRIPMPADMRGLIAQYEYGLKYRLYEIVNHLAAGDRLAAGSRPEFVHDAARVRALPPIIYPGKILNAAGNFYSHINETGTPEEIAATKRARREKRGVPYLFLKPAEGAVIGQGDAIVIPHGRDRTDWEVELATVIGRPAKYVSAAAAQDYVFGYMVSLDISDRGGRPPGGNPVASDWFVGKGHDTFAPMGPWIVPKEFYGDPMAKLRQTLSVGGTRMQEATAGDMIHSIWELIEYASSIITLFPGDVINNGTSGGTGAGTAFRGEQRFLKPGEEIVATIDGIGTLRLPVVGEAAPPAGTGARLPPVNSYRK